METSCQVSDGFHGVTIQGRWSRYGGQSLTPSYFHVGRVQFTLGIATGLGQGVIVTGEAPPQGIDQATIQLARESANNLVGAPANALRRSYFVPAIRGIERQSYDLGEVSTDDLVSPEGSLRVSQALATTFAYRRELEDEISNWMERVTNRRVRVRLSAGRKVSLDTIIQGQAVNIANEGFGSNQLSHMLTQLALLPRDATLAIEEPEIHLHPSAQTQLVNVLVEATASRGSQLLMTTHSEHVLYALMALVGEGKLKREDVAIHHVAIEGGQTKVNTLEVDSTGRIKGGLPGFFNVHVQEFRRFLDAAERKE